MPTLSWFLPRVTTMYEIIAYYNGGLLIALNIISPMPNTVKFDMNVKVLRKLFSLSYIIMRLLFAFENKSVMVRDSYDWFALLPSPHWIVQGKLCNKHTRWFYYRIEMFGRWGCSKLWLEWGQPHTMVFSALFYLLFTIFCLCSVWKIPNHGCGNSVCDLASEKSWCSCRCLDYSFEEVEQIVKPAGSYQIINEMANTIS